MMTMIHKPLSVMSKLLAISTAVLIVFVARWRLKGETVRRRKRKKDRSVNIGAIFGMDVGGTLAKIVFFEKMMNEEFSPTDLHNEDMKRIVTDGNGCNTNGNSTANGHGEHSMNGKMRRSDKSLDNLDKPDHQMALQQLYSYMENSGNDKNEKSGMHRDSRLTFYSDTLGGRFHFLSFETRNMIPVLDRIAATSITENIHTIGCTGGGAHKYAREFSDRLDITLQQTDELASLIRGMHFALTQSPNECYTYRHVGGPNGFLRDRSPPPDSPPRPPYSDGDSGSKSSKYKTKKKKSLWHQDVKECMQKVLVTGFDTTRQFPYLVVNIGSGVSILKVTAPGTFERVSGSSLGGGTYWGLCRLLTRCSTYEEVLSKAEDGDNTEIDMLVKDIYGGGYENMNLSGTMVASSFGKFVMKDRPKEGLKDEDVAISLLMMITNNIGQVSYLNAKLHGCSKIFFVGSFLRHNAISCRRLAFAIHFWSKGEMEALFLHHEGYFGALGTLLQCGYGPKVDHLLAEKDMEREQNGNEGDEGDEGSGEREGGAKYVATSMVGRIECRG